jgi:SAM-dependent methyltransferase
VVAWELLEHFDSPKAFLNAVRRHLKPGGWFLGSTPNGGSSWLRLLREGWHGCGIPQYHRVYYNQDAVRSAFAVAGFDNVATTTCVDWKGSLLIKNTATILTRRHLQTNNIIVRAVVAGAIAAPQKAAEVLSGHVPWIDGDTLLFAARSCPDVPLQ